MYKLILPIISNIPNVNDALSELPNLKKEISPTIGRNIQNNSKNIVENNIIAIFLVFPYKLSNPVYHIQ